MAEQHHQKLSVLAKQLVETHIAAAFCAKEISAEIQTNLQAFESAAHGQATSSGAELRRQRPLLDESRLCVIWRDRMVHLGYTISYRVLDYLARRPNQYVRQLDMIHEIWDDEHLEFSTVRSFKQYTVDLLRLAIFARSLLTNTRIREYLDMHHSAIVQQFEAVIAEARG